MYFLLAGLQLPWTQTPALKSRVFRQWMVQPQSLVRPYGFGVCKNAADGRCALMNQNTSNTTVCGHSCQSISDTAMDGIVSE